MRFTQLVNQSASAKRESAQCFVKSIPLLTRLEFQRQTHQIRLCVMALLSKVSISCSPNTTPAHTFFSNSSKTLQMSHKFASSSPASSNNYKLRKLPILLFDIMDTIVRDPFYQDVPAFFRMSFKELIESKHPTAWAEFEKGLINEIELGRKFFKDSRPLDMDGLKNCMKNGYTYLEGMETLLQGLKQNNYEMHAFTNYPEWYKLIEEKLRISNFLSWTFCSCIIGKRKPEADAYLEASRQLNVDPTSCIFIDDRMVNVEAARNVGMVGIHLKNAASLEKELSLLGVEIRSSNKDSAIQD